MLKKRWFEGKFIENIRRVFGLCFEGLRVELKMFGRMSEVFFRIFAFFFNAILNIIGWGYYFVLKLEVLVMNL